MSSEEGRRKLAAILAGDVAGYSRLMAADDRATVAALKQAREVFRERIEARSGRLIDTAGDSVLAEFPSVVEAVECAVAVQERLAEINDPLPAERRMLFRIGVNQGDVIEEADGTVYGGGVNVAARLEGLAEPGTIAVSARVYDDVEDRLDIGFVDIGEHEVKNIAKPVRAYRVVPEGQAAPAPAKPRSRFLPYRTAAAVSVVILAVVLWQAFGPPSSVPRPADPVLAMPTGPSIAVLPFENLSAAPEHAYYADGMTDQLVTELARFRDLLVVAGTSTAQADVKDAANELGVRYLLKGNVLTAADTVRVAAQLLDGGNGATLWAETYERDLTAANIFALQDDIAAQVVATLASTSGVLSREQRWQATRSTTASLSAYECVLLGHHFADTFVAETHLAARDCLEVAVKAERDYVDAWAWLAVIYNFGYGMAFNPGPDYRTLGLEAAQQAVRLDANSQLAHYAMALSHFLRQELDEFEEEAETAIALNPNNAEVVAELAEKIAYMGQWQRGEELMRKAMALNPMYPSWYWFTIAYVHLAKGEYDRAVEAAQKINMPDFDNSVVVLAIAYERAGRRSEAEAAVASALRVNPDLTIEAYAEGLRRWNQEPNFIALQVDALRNAGLPEAPKSPSRPVIAVLPFDNLSGDPSQEYFADGITEDIITRLAQYPDILVLGRNTTFQFKGQAVDIPTIAETLGADYVVEGSIRRGGDTVRVSAQLLGGDGGIHVWAETYDRKLDPENLFAVQDVVTEAVASRIGDAHGAVSRAEFERTSRHTPEHLSSYECVLRYYEHDRRLTAESHLAVRNCLEHVVETEPEYGAAASFLAMVYHQEVTVGFNPSPETSLAQALEMGERGVRHDPNSGVAHANLAIALLLTGYPERAGREAEEAVRLAPNDAMVLGNAALVQTKTGGYDQGKALMDKLMVINPNYPPWMNWQIAQYHLVQYEYLDTIKWVERTGMDWWHWYHTFLAAAHCANGGVERGQEALIAAREANPQLEEAYWPEMYLWNKGDGVRPLIDVLDRGLEACGWEVPPDPGPEAFRAQ
jgi:adenylate cyclase